MDARTEKLFQEFLKAQAAERKEKEINSTIGSIVFLVLAFVVWRLWAAGLL